MGLLPAVVATGGSMKHCAAQPVQWLLLICLVVGVSCRKLASETRLPADFLQLESLAEDHRSLLSAGRKEHRTRMDSYKNLKQTITKLGNQAHPGNGASLAVYVDSVKSLLNTSMIQAINSQFQADDEILKRGVKSFPLCDTILEKALEPSNAVRDGKGSYQGLAKLKVKHNDCRGRQEEKKIQYDMCNDQKENEQQLMTASCDQNFTKFYQKAGATTTGQWGATCDTKQSTYQQNAPADIPLIHHPSIGTVDVEGYLIEQFDYFSTMVSDYKYAEKLCYNRTRTLEDTKKRCEKLFQEHGDITAECDNSQDTLDAESCSQAEQRHRACLAYDRCHDKAVSDMASLKHDFCLEGGQEDMLKSEAKAIAQVDCMLDALRLYSYDSRMDRLASCIADVNGTWDASLMAKLDFKECDYENSAKKSADLTVCASHTNPMNDNDMSGTPGYIAKYYSGPPTSPNGYPLPGSKDDDTDTDNAPKTDVKECVSTCCKHPPVDGWEKVEDKTVAATLTEAKTPATVRLASGTFSISQLPENLRSQVDIENLPPCGFCGTETINGAEKLVKCFSCWGKCCDPAGVTACAEKNKGKATTCKDESTVSLLSLSSGLAAGSVTSHHVKVFSASVTATRRTEEPISKSKKWQNLLSRARRQIAARLRRA